MKVKIGDLARLADCQVVTIRYYEKEGLLGEPDRSERNYRLYSGEDVERLRFIRHCRGHGMKLSEIRDLLAYRDQPATDCRWINDLIAAHLDNVERQIEALHQLKSTLQGLQSKCSGHNTGQACGILKSLASPELCGCCAHNDRLQKAHSA